MSKNNFVWIFNYKSNNHVSFPSGVFFTREKAQKWVAGLGIEGLLTPYPIDTSVNDWAVRNHFFNPQIPEESSPDFIAKFILNYYQQYLVWVEQKIALNSKTDTQTVGNSDDSENRSRKEERIEPFSEVWAFTAYSSVRTGLASAVFLTKRKAKNWIKKKDIEGLLTPYPVDIGTYDWAIQNDYFTPKKPHEFEPLFIGTFNSRKMHFHFTRDESGKLNG